MFTYSCCLNNQPGTAKKHEDAEALSPRNQQGNPQARNVVKIVPAMAGILKAGMRSWEFQNPQGPDTSLLRNQGVITTHAFLHVYIGTCTRVQYIYIYLYIYICIYLYIYMYTHTYQGAGRNQRFVTGPRARTRDIPRYKGYATGRCLLRQTLPLALLTVIVSRATKRDKVYVTSPGFHTVVADGCWRGSSGTGFRPIAIYFYVCFCARRLLSGVSSTRSRRVCVTKST